MTEEKYIEFINIVCEMLGLNKPIDILKVCQITSDFIKPYEMKIKDLEQVNEQLEIDNYNHNANLQRLSDMLDEAKKIIKDLLRSARHRCTGEEFFEIRDKAEIFIRAEE